MSTSVNLSSKLHEQQIEDWTLANDLLGGSKSMREAGERYAPKNEAESDSAYKARLARTFLYGVYENTVDSMAGLPFQKPVSIAEGAPQTFIDHSNDIDQQGRSLTSFANDLVRQVVAKGITYIFVDHPSAEPTGTRSKQEETELGLRPYWVHVYPENLLEVDYSFSSGAIVINKIRIREFIEEADKGDPFKKNEVEQVRVVYPDRFEVWRKIDGKEEWGIHKNGMRSVNKVTLVPVYARQGTPFQSKPPLLRLMETNVQHWQVSSDHNTLVHKASVFLLFGKQLELTDDKGNPKKLTTDSLITSSDADGDLKVVEHSGEAIEKSQAHLKSVVDYMESLGGMLLVPDQFKTATEQRSHDRKGDSRLHTIIGNVEDALEKAAGFHMLWLGDKKAKITVDIFSEFSLVDHNYMSADDWLKALMAEAVPLELYLKNMQIRGLIPSELKVEDIIEMIQNQVLVIPKTKDDEAA